MRFIQALLLISISSFMLAGGHMSHAHMKHVYESWNDTPDKEGLLPTAIAEAKIALTHAGFALKKSNDMAWMKLHTTHIAHALSGEGKGPGLGYGLIKASNGTAKHIGFAASSPGASANVKAHSVHIETSANNAVMWSKEALELTALIASSSNPNTVKALLGDIVSLLEASVSGQDANNDGKITWQKNEGGLMEADKHMGFMRKGENI